MKSTVLVRNFLPAQSGRTALHQAAHSGCFVVAEALIEAGADLEATTLVRSHDDLDGRNLVSKTRVAAASSPLLRSPSAVSVAHDAASPSLTPRHFRSPLTVRVNSPPLLC